jgi:hypothetical protein
VGLSQIDNSGPLFQPRRMHFAAYGTANLFTAFLLMFIGFALRCADLPI